MSIEGFFYNGVNRKTTDIGGYPLEFLHKHQCRICPLKRQDGFKAKHPDIPARGGEEPLIYMLGEAPGEEEDIHRAPFVGRSGRYLRERIPASWHNDDLRWSNVVRTRPKGNATPEDMAIECCRPSVAADIAASRPEAIFGFGNVPLHWALRRNGISKWNGRRIPVDIAGHACWYFPMLHPSYVVRLSGAAQRDQGMRKQYEEASFVFDLDLKRALAAVADGLPEPVVHNREDAERDVELLYGHNSVIEALQWFHNEQTVGIDLETHGLRPYSDGSRVLSCAISGHERSIAFPIGHPQSDWNEQQRDMVWLALLNFLTEAPCRKVQFTPFEMEWLAQRTSRDILWSRWADAQGQAYLLDARQGTLSLDFLCLQYFGIDLKAISNVDVDNLIDAPLDLVLSYNALDAKYCRLLYLEQAQRIEHEGLQDVWQHHNKRVTASVLTQLQGVPVNPATVAALDQKYSGALDALSQEIQDDPTAQAFAQTRRRRFRPSANADIKAIFPQLEDTAQEEDLLQLDNPLAKLILRWKHFAKVHSTYIAPVLPGHERCALSDDGMLHPALLVNRVRTWRSSSEAPNIQNWPKHDEGREARSQIEAPPGHAIVAFDYGQIQARNVAQESLDKKLVRSMWERHDIHSDWRDRIFQLHPAWATEGLTTVLQDKGLLKQYRQKAKNGFVFASFFGAGGRTVAGHLGIPENIGYQLAEEFDHAFPGITSWQKGLHRSYQRDGYVTGLSGFRRYAPVAHTEIINTPIQSDEAVIVFDAMIRLAETGEPHFVANLMVHDSLEFVWPKNKIDHYAEFVVKTIMECPFPWVRTVPMQIEMGIGSNWADIKEVAVFETDKNWNWK
jgi:uracil-DNA glycosylase family 4